MGIFNRDKGEGRDPSLRPGEVSFDPPSEGETHEAGAHEASGEAHDDAVVHGVSEPYDGDVPIVDVLGEEAHEPVVERPVELVASESGPATPGAKRSLFGRSQEPKPGKGPKPPRAIKVKRGKDTAVDELPIPITVVIDFFQGVTKEREAEQIARAQIEKNFDAPNAAFLYTQRWRGGIAVEMQEGGGRAFLPEILAKLDEDDKALIAVPMSNRFAQVRLDPDTKSLETLLLTANQSPPEDAFTVLPTKPMQPFDRRGSKVFVGGVALLAASAIAMVFSVGAFFIDTQAWSLPYLAQTEPKILPAAQGQQMQATLNNGDCIYKMEFVNGSWAFTAGYDNGAGVCGLTKTAPPPVAADVGSLTPDVSATTPPGVPGVATGTPSGGVLGSVPQGAAPSPAPGAGPGPAPAGALPSGALPPVVGAGQAGSPAK